MTSPGDYLRSRRDASGLSLRDVAERAGVSHVFVLAMEAGRKRVPADLVPALGDAIPRLNRRTLGRLVRIAEPVPLVIVPRSEVQRECALELAWVVDEGLDDSTALQILSCLGGRG